jgi:hypothetical protein
VIDEDVVAGLTATREGFEPIACTPVALPCWHLLVRVELLARREISPLEEFVLRAAQEADPKVGAIQALLGLDDHTFEETLATVCSREWAKITPDAQLALTEKGRQVAETRRRERSEDRPVWVDFDGLLRRPMLLDQPLEPTQVRSLGLLELPAWPPRAPDTLELTDRASELQALIRRAGDGRDQEIDLLAVKGVLRRERVYREATLVVFRSGAGEVQAVPVVDGLPSTEHELSLAAPEVFRSLRLPSELRRGRRYDQLLPIAARALHDQSADAAASALRLRARTPHLAAEADGEPEELRRQAAEATRRLAVRQVDPQEHPRLLRIALRTTQARLLIAVPSLSPQSMDAELLGDLRALLGRGVEITILHSTAAQPPLPGFVRSLFERDGAKELRLRSPLRASTLVRDSNLAIRTLYPLLSDQGLLRPVRDERGWLVTDPQQVSALGEEVLREAGQLDDSPPE